MTIVCLGWGSLVWDPGELPIRNNWQTVGPSLPIEFARKSRDGRITLVIAEDTPSIPVLWSTLDVSSLDEARQALAEREDVKQKNFKQSIGAWSPSFATTHAEAAQVAAWAESMGVMGVVWTALKARFPPMLGKPSCDQVVQYLAQLTGETRTHAETYVRRAPAEIRTPYRAEIERQLGWTFTTTT
jgi:hypothetical protein